MRHHSELDLHLERGETGTTLAGSLVQRIRQSILTGVLKPGDRLPASRRLAGQLGVARGTITSAIDILVSQDLLVARRGAGVFVSEAPARLDDTESGLSADFVVSLPEVPPPDMDSAAEARFDFRPCRPSTREFPQQHWKRCLAMAAAGERAPDYGDPCGSPELRRAIADYLRRSRGLVAKPDEIIVTSGIIHAVGLLSALFLERGAKVIMEDPGYPLARQVLQTSGAEVLPCPVDDNGLIVEALPESGRDFAFVYVTPSHQFPMGSRLSPSRREALIGWAAKNRVIVLEDDYDGEFRFDVPPLPPLAAMRNNCVVHLGTFSKTLFPNLRIGFAVAPAPLIEAMQRYRAIHEYAPNSVVQAALAEFIRAGHFEKHIHRMRRVYRAKRLTLRECLTEYDIPGKLIGLESGLHAVLMMPREASAERISAAARHDGLLVPPAGRYHFGPESPPNGLVIGYSEPDIETLKSGLRRLALLIRR